MSFQATVSSSGFIWEALGGFVVRPRKGREFNFVQAPLPSMAWENGFGLVVGDYSRTTAMGCPVCSSFFNPYHNTATVLSRPEKGR